MSDKQPLLCGRRVYVCDTTGVKLMSMDDLMFHITEKPGDSEITLTSESYGFFCGSNMLLIGNAPYVAPRNIEREPGSSDPSQFGAGLMTGILLGDLQ